MFRLVDKKRQEAENPVLRWKKTMPNYSLSHGKMSIADIPIDILKSSVIINGPSQPDSKHKGLYFAWNTINKLCIVTVFEG